MWLWLLMMVIVAVVLDLFFDGSRNEKGDKKGVEGEIEVTDNGQAVQLP
jgi:hypothetical protein